MLTKIQNLHDQFIVPWPKWVMVVMIDLRLCVEYNEVF